MNTRDQWLLLLFSLVLGACDGGGAPAVEYAGASTAPRTVTLSWLPNRESAVNAPGGGYAVHYSERGGFTPGSEDAARIDVPYVSGAEAPTSAMIALTPGRYYFRVTAYSALRRADGQSAISAPSPEIEILVQ